MGNLFYNREAGLVSVVIPAYNRAGFIGETLDSIRNQTYENIEVVIVDDCSTDNTGEVVNSWRLENPQAFKSFLYVKLPRNSDEEWAYNIGFCLTRGEFIAQQNSDDISHRERIQKQVEHLLKNQETAAVGTRFYVCLENMEHMIDTSFWLSYKREEIERNYKSNYHCVCTGTIMFRAALLEEIIGYKKATYGCNDVGFLCDIVKHEYILDNINEVLFYYREHQKQKLVQMKEPNFIDKKMHQIKGRASVVLPVYRNSNHILSILENILKQTYHDMEIIIADDLQNEKLEQEVKDFYSDYMENHQECGVKEFFYFKLPRKLGYPWIYNIGAYLSMGEYVVFHGDDGISEKDKIVKQAEFLNDHFMYAGVGTNFDPERDWIRYDDEIENSYLLDYKPCINMNTVMLRANIINTTGGMNQSMAGRENFEFIHRLIEDNHRMQNIRDILYYDYGGGA